MTQVRKPPLSSDATTNKIGLKSFGPGILMASAAIGGSHLIASTQAGAIYGWQLAIAIVLANFFKYPFFRFGTEYAYRTGNSLIAGYAQKSRAYLWVYFVLSVVSGVISVGAVALLSAVILGHLLPLGLSGLSFSVVVVLGAWLLLLFGKFHLLDNLNKVIVAGLTLTTIAAVCIAATKTPAMAADFTPISPWTAVGIAFIVQLMGWMPAPLEFSAITSVWTVKKIRADRTTFRQGLLDFNVGYITSAVLALFFLALGVFVQYGTGEPIANQGGAYVGQLIRMYTQTIGDWAKPLVAIVAFLCMFGTTITCIDGYGRANAECVSLILKRPLQEKWVLAWATFTAAGGFVLIGFFGGQMAALLKFAMIYAFVSAPIFAYLNYSLAKSQYKLSAPYRVYALLGIAFLVGFTALFFLVFFGIIA